MDYDRADEAVEMNKTKPNEAMFEGLASHRSKSLTRVVATYDVAQHEILISKGVSLTVTIFFFML